MLRGADMSTVVFGPAVGPSYQLVVLTKQVYLSPACATKELHRMESASGLEHVSLSLQA